MLCYLDRSFCSSDCVNRECPRNLTPEHDAQARERKLAVSFANYREGCEEYRAPPEPKQ